MKLITFRLLNLLFIYFQLKVIMYRILIYLFYPEVHLIHVT